MPLILNGDGSIGPLSATEVGYLDGVTSAVQTQINNRAIANGSWTPAFYSMSVGNGTLVARYGRSGNIVTAYIGLTLGSTSTISQDARFDPASLPLSVAGSANLVGITVYIDASAGPMWYSGGMFGGYFMHSSNAYGRLAASNPFTWTTGDALHCSFSYEAA